MVLTHVSPIPESLYLHYPVCRHHCSYCDFNVYPASKIDSKANFDKEWKAVLLRHLKVKFQSEGWSSGLPLKTLYIGGGTPSFLSEETLKYLIAELKAFFSFDSDLEFTLEVNPEDIELEKLRTWKQLGVNRISLGLQSFQELELKRLERLSSLTKLEKALDFIRSNFENFSVDLMFAIPDQNLAALESNIRQLLSFKPPHISIYLLTIPEDHKWNRSTKISALLPQDDLIQQMYVKICRSLKNESYEHYEVSNFARPGFHSRHNSSYWDPQKAYLGLGPGAHGYDCYPVKRRYENFCDFRAWQNSEDGIETREILSAPQQRIEELYLSLRSRKPLDPHPFGSDLISKLVDESLCELSAEGILVKEEAWLVLDSIAARLLQRL